jgi:hypothetical protein
LEFSFPFNPNRRCIFELTYKLKLDREEKIKESLRRDEKETRNSMRKYKRMNRREEKRDPAMGKSSVLCDQTHF